ncbi:MAG TPA: hypothetical protein VGD63_11365 [Steroidobacteraceae bacterium]
MREVLLFNTSWAKEYTAEAGFALWSTDAEDVDAESDLAVDAEERAGRHSLAASAQGS